jgi:hypothetical protein
MPWSISSGTIALDDIQRLTTPAGVLVWAETSARSMVTAPAILTLPSADRLIVVWPVAVAVARSLSMSWKPFRSSLKLPTPSRARLIRPAPLIVPPLTVFRARPG